jgi:hypothetical protein
LRLRLLRRRPLLPLRQLLLRRRPPFDRERPSRRALHASRA